MNTDIFKKMTVVVGGVTFTKIIGYYNGNVYANEYGEYIKDSSAVHTFDELIDSAVEFLKTKS
jgi:hypothetical protein